MKKIMQCDYIEIKMVNMSAIFVRLPDLANKYTECPVIFEFQISNELFVACLYKKKI